MDRLLRWILMAMIAGPLGATLGWLLLDSVHLMGRMGARVLPVHMVPILGATVAAFLIVKHPAIAGTGGDAYIATLQDKHRTGFAGPWLSLLKVLATALTVGSGGSGGLAGPALHIGTGTYRITDFLMGHQKRLDERDMRTTRIVGAAATLAAITGTPLAAGILSVEILDRASIDYRELPPAILAATAGTLCFQWFTGRTPTLLPTIPSPDLIGILAAVLTALVAGVAGLGLVRLLLAIRRLYRGYAPRPLPIILGATVTSLLALAVGTEILGWGVVESLNGYVSADPVGTRGWFLLAGKVLGTASTVGTGGSGGVVGPALVIGVFAGNGVAATIGASISGASVAGMAAALAAISNVPIAAAIMMVELFGGSATIYACIGSALGFQIARSAVAYFSLAEKQ